MFFILIKSLNSIQLDFIERYELIHYFPCSSAQCLHTDLICIHSPLWSDPTTFPILFPQSFFMCFMCSNHTTGTRFPILTWMLPDPWSHSFLCPEFSLCLSQSVSSPRFKALPNLSERINSATILNSPGTLPLSSATKTFL